MIENLEKRCFTLFLGNQSENAGFYYISAAQFSDTHAYFRVFYTASKKLIKRAALFQSAAAIPDHQQPWRKDR